MNEVLDRLYRIEDSLDEIIKALGPQKRTARQEKSDLTKIRRDLLEVRSQVKQVYFTLGVKLPHLELPLLEQ